MYSIIKDLNTGININIRSVEGIQLINKYYKSLVKNNRQSGGKAIGMGTYKCVFKPAIRCLGSKSRYGGKNWSDYISALTTYTDSQTELKMEKIRAKIDPREKFTIKIRKTCSVGELDQIKEEKISEFNACTNTNSGNFLNGKWRPTKIPYLYPYSTYSNKSPNKILSIGIEVIIGESFIDKTSILNSPSTINSPSVTLILTNIFPK